MRGHLESAIGIVGIGLGVGSLPAQHATTVDSLCGRVLSAKVVGNETGLADLVLIPRLSVPSAGGTCNYATGGKTMVLLLTVLDEKEHAVDQYTRYKSQAQYQVNQRPVTGLGDAAFTSGAYEHQVIVRQGSRVIFLVAMVHMDRATHQMHATLTRDQLLSLAQQVVAKL